MANHTEPERSGPKDLKAEYRDAFQRWAVQVVQFHLARGSAEWDPFTSQRRVCVEDAESAYRVARNRFAAKLMQRSDVNDPPAVPLSPYPV